MSVSVVIPTFNRIESLVRTISAVKNCHPAPDEIIVHVDAGDNRSADAVLSVHSDIRVIKSSITLGPGGSRNRLLDAAQNEIVVSLDDDSFPIDDDFFAAVERSAAENSAAAVIAMNIIHDDEPMITRSRHSQEVVDFVGCGCMYRKSIFFETGGYVPIQPAYGMEEADLSLQLFDIGWSIVHDADLRVRHATTRAHQSSRAITSAHISNVALLVFLRYPVTYWGYGLIQMANRVIWSLRNRRYSGIVTGILVIPRKMWRFRRYRRPVRAATLRKIRKIRQARLASTVHD